MITARGAGLFLVAVAVYVLGGATRIWWLLLFDSVIWGTMIVAAVLPWLAVGNLRVRRRVVGWEGGDEELGPMEGSAVRFDLTLTNEGLLPCMFVTVRHNCGGLPADAEKADLFLAWLGRRSTLSSTPTVRYERRGLHLLPPVTVETRAPFGLFRRSKRVGASMELLVLPKVLPVSRMELLGGAAEAKPTAHRDRIGDQVAGSRHYVPGERSSRGLIALP